MKIDWKIASWIVFRERGYGIHLKEAPSTLCSAYPMRFCFEGCIHRSKLTRARNTLKLISKKISVCRECYFPDSLFFSYRKENARHVSHHQDCSAFGCMFRLTQLNQPYEWCQEFPSKVAGKQSDHPCHLASGKSCHLWACSIRFPCTQKCSDILIHMAYPPSPELVWLDGFLCLVRIIVSESHLRLALHQRWLESARFQLR